MDDGKILKENQGQKCLPYDYHSLAMVAIAKRDNSQERFFGNAIKKYESTMLPALKKAIGNLFAN